MITRKSFLEIIGVAAVAAVVDACSPTPQITPSAIPPTGTSIPPTPTSEPTTAVISPIIPEMVLVLGGTFDMGSPDGYDNELPIHGVTISNPFYMGKYEVTYEEFDAFCEDIQRYSRPDDEGQGRGKRPVAGVTWYDAAEYCNWLSEKEGLVPCYSGTGKLIKCDFSANGYRLPTEAEWEYAARGGPTSQGFIFAGSNNPDDVAWYSENAGDAAQAVGQKEPNEIGLYDMSGNSFEWCWDWYVDDYYNESPSTDPLGPPLPTVDFPWQLARVRRSGSWGENPSSIRAASRSFDDPAYAGSNGFRLARGAMIE